MRRNWLEDALLVLSGAIPGAWAASRAPLAFDMAHVLGASRTTGPAWTGAWRAFDIAWSQVFVTLPVGTHAYRSVLASAFALALTGVVVHVVARRLLPVGLLSAALATVASLVATLAPSMQMEGSAPGGSVLGALLVLATIGFFAHERIVEGAFALGLAASYEVDTFLCALAALALLRARPPKRTIVAFVLGLLPLIAVVLAKGRFSPALSTDVRMFASPLGEGAGQAELRELVLAELGLVAFALACGGAALAVLRKEARRLGNALVAVCAIGAGLSRFGAPSGPDRFAPCVLAALCSCAALSALAMHELAVRIARIPVPYARAGSVMVVVLLLALPMKTADDTALRLGDTQQDKTAEWSTDAVLPLAPHAAIVVDSKPIVQLLIALRASGELAPDVTLIPTSDVNGRLASHVVLRDPALAPLARDLVLDGTPQEYALSEIATVRPVFVAYDPRWDRALARHLLPQGAFDRFLGEPRGPSDRKRALDAFGPVRDRLAKSTRGDAELRRTTASLLRARALAVGAAGDKDAAKRTVEDLRKFAPSDATGREIVKRIVAADGPVDVADLSP